MPDFFKAYKYLSDDGETYQVGVEEYLAAPGAGDLILAAGNERPMPALSVTRYMSARGIFAGETKTVKVVCNPNHPAWIEGPGAELLIVGETFTVVRCVGERRLQQ